MASSRMQAVVPVPQVQTTGCDRSSPASLNACSSCSGGFSLQQQAGTGRGQAGCLSLLPQSCCPPDSSPEARQRPSSSYEVLWKQQLAGRRTNHLPSCSTFAKARLVLPGMWPSFRPGRGSGASPFHLQARQRRVGQHTVSRVNKQVRLGSSRLASHSSKAWLGAACTTQLAPASPG